MNQRFNLKVFAVIESNFCTIIVFIISGLRLCSTYYVLLCIHVQEYTVKEHTLNEMLASSSFTHPNTNTYTYTPTHLHTGAM